MKSGLAESPFCYPIMEGMKYGYARVSTEDQNAAMQHKHR